MSASGRRRGILIQKNDSWNMLQVRERERKRGRTFNSS